MSPGNENEPGICYLCGKCKNMVLGESAKLSRTPLKFSFPI